MSSKEDKKAEKLRLTAEKKAAKEAEKAIKKVSKEGKSEFCSMTNNHKARCTAVTIVRPRANRRSPAPQLFRLSPASTH